MSTAPFDFQSPTRIVFGVDSIQRLGQLARELGAQRVLVTSDRGVVQAGHTQRGIDSLRDAGLIAHCIDQVRENPSTDDVAAGLDVARQFQPNLLVGLGGGSSMDCAKGINFLYTNGGHMKDYWGVGKAREPMLPMIAVPTTAGTGSETQSFALDFRRADPRQNGMRRQESGLSSGNTRSAFECHSTTACDGADRHRRDGPRPGNTGYQQMVPHVATVQLRSLAPAGRQLPTCAHRSI